MLKQSLIGVVKFKNDNMLICNLKNMKQILLIIYLSEKIFQKSETIFL